MLDRISSVAKSIIGSNAARNKHRLAQDQQTQLAQSLSILRQQEPSSAGPTTKPIFILSAGWRSGSTLLQRLVMSSPDTLIWGEVYDHCGIVQKLARSITAIDSNWPPQSYLAQPKAGTDLARQWTANLYPPMSQLKLAHRAMLDTLLADPAEQQQAERWGMKEVRFGLLEAQYLRWLYPQAKLLFIYRNPYDAFASYKSFNPSLDWFANWPDRPTFTARAFGAHWCRLTKDFVEHAKLLDGLTVKYEDLVSGAFSLSQLEDYCELTIDKNILRVGVGGAKVNANQGLSAVERWQLQAYVNPVARQLGYQATT